MCSCKRTIRYLQISPSCTAWIQTLQTLARGFRIFRSATKSFFVWTIKCPPRVAMEVMRTRHRRTRTEHPHIIKFHRSTHLCPFRPCPHPLSPHRVATCQRTWTPARYATSNRKSVNPLLQAPSPVNASGSPAIKSPYPYGVNKTKRPEEVRSPASVTHSPSLDMICVEYTATPFWCTLTYYELN